MTKFFILQLHDPSSVYAFVMARGFDLKPNLTQGEISFDFESLIITKLVSFSYKQKGVANFLSLLTRSRYFLLQVNAFLRFS